MGKNNLIFLSISMVLILFLISSILPDLATGNSINKTPPFKTKDSNLKQIYERDYNPSVEQKKILKSASKISDKNKLNIDNSNFKLKKIKEDYKNNEEILSYEQEYNGVPVHGSFLILIKKNDEIIAIKKNYYRGIDINTKKNISNEQINEFIGKELNITLKSNFNKLTFKDVKFIKTKDKKVILPVKGEKDIEYKLVQRIDLPVSKSPFASWIYFIDINTGELIKKTNKIISANVTGYVSEKIYPEYPNQSTPFQDQPFLRGYVSIQYGINRSFYSGSGNNLDNHITTKDKIDLKDVSSVANLSFSTKYEIETNYDFAYVWIKKNDSAWDLIGNYTGTQSEWINKNINLSEYIGNDILLAFEYVTDDSIIYEGFYLDNVKVDTDQGIKFQEDFKNETNQWNNTGFSVARSYLSESNNYTNINGFYNINSTETNSTIYSYLSGPFVNVINNAWEDDVYYDYDINTSGTYNWSWFDYDSSYKQRESNLFYHVNKVHDFFTKGSPFDISNMNYQVNAVAEYYAGAPCYCNAFTDGTDLYFCSNYTGSCEASALYSDVIYHEYTHCVVEKVYDPVELPYVNQSGAMNEAWADYFAATINNNSCIGEGWAGLDCLRNLNNSNKYPDDIVNEVHEDGKIFAGALWDLRSKVNADLADNLTISTMKLKAQNFSEYLDDMLFVDNDGVIPSNGTPHWYQICSSFSRHGIISNFCSPIILDYNQSIEIKTGEIKNTSITWENPILSTQSNINYCSPSFSDCSSYNYESSTDTQSGSEGNYTANISINEEGTWKFFVYTISDDINYSSSLYDISVTKEPDTVCGDGVCNGTESCSSCPSDCGVCSVPPSGGGGGTSSLQEWTFTKTITETQIKDGYTQELAKKQRVKFSLSSQDHYVGIKSISGNSVLVELASTPQEVVFLVNETKKFNLTSDSYYDLQITMNSLENNKANLSLIEIYEIMENETKEIESPVNESFQTSPETPPSNKTWTYILIALVVIALALLIYFKLNKPFFLSKIKTFKKNN